VTPVSPVSPVVLLAGMNCTPQLWHDVGLEHGILPVLGRATIADQVDELLRILPPRFTLVGHSLGGIVGMALALKAPERVAGLCLTCTNAKAPTPEQRAGWLHWMRRLDEGADPLSLQQDILPALLGAEPAATRPPESWSSGSRRRLEQRALDMARQSESALLRAQLAMQLTRTDLLGRLSTLDLPTLVVSGARDAICPPPTHSEIAARVAGAELVTLDAGHLLPAECPREFAEAFRRWQDARVVGSARR
jgi:pimeloyl-ACP methyl ester carboxylesterase